MASKIKFSPKAYPLRKYQKPASIAFPTELPIAFAVCSAECGSQQFIVDGGTQVCENCGRLMFRTKVRRYLLASPKKKKGPTRRQSQHG